MAIRTVNLLLHSRHGDRPFLADATYTADGKAKPVVLFIHGFKGFKDWGTFPLIARAFAESGFVFVKLNLSRNGTTPEQPLDFADLEAFGRNNFSLELDDIGRLIDYIHRGENPELAKEIASDLLYMVAHSRGGGLAILKAGEDPRVKKVATWASVIDFRNLWKNESEEEWQQKGVIFIPNSRTGQQMPLYYQLFEDYVHHQERLNIRQAVQNLTVPLLVIHGDADETVPVESAYELRNLHEHALMHIIPNGNHTFAGTHPFDKSELPLPTQEAVARTISFLRNEAK